MFNATPRSRGHSEDAEGIYETHAWGNFSVDGSHSKFIAQGKKDWKKITVHMEYFGHTTYLQPSELLKAGDCFSRQSDGCHQAHFSFINCTAEWKLFGRVDKF